MPRSKRSKLVTLSNTEKKTKEDKTRLFDDIRSALDEYKNLFILKLDNIRTPILQDIRNNWTGSKIILGKKKVIQKALGETIEEEYKQDLHKLSKTLSENFLPGLLFTNEDKSTVEDYFGTFVKNDYSRIKTKSPIDFTIPEGIIYSRGGQISIEEDVPMSHSLEETFRNKYKIPTKIKSGKIWLDEPFEVCKKDDILNVTQTLILKQFGIAASEFKIPLIGSYIDENVTIY
ncbi:unnamed protein product [Candida verbasci]|uniref:Ribosome assembly factor mrt4 n=1 Tax=Candida verbasci TaxID=1227364 RepID=A0A9W4U0L1_9ASCO|nr:unnamed protein product [Candida verbasci]